MQQTMGQRGVGKSVLGWALCIALAGCGGGGDGLGNMDDLALFQQRTAASDPLAARCQYPRSGTDPYNGHRPYPDRQGSLDDERRWLRTYMGEVYLWYREIPSVNAAPYNTANYPSVGEALDAYFEALLTRATTASGKLKDQFSFTYPTDLWDALSQGGVSYSYGMQVTLLAIEPSRRAVIAYVEPDTPAAGAGIGRGTQILAVDGVAVADGDEDVLYAGLYPDAGDQHSFRILDRGQTVPRDVTLIAQSLASIPVLKASTYDAAGVRVGYMLFNDHIATAEGGLMSAVQGLRNAGISDLVVDLRYNGGGYLDIASELAYMIAGDKARGKVFERTRYNDKHPLNRSSLVTTPFHTAALGLDPRVARGSALPTLNLNRVFVLTGSGTCSASEALINGLRGIDVQVIQIGGTSCGKPYGFYAQDNCGLSYFAIEMQGVNAKDEGNYADGLSPVCAVADDFAHDLSDPAEALLATAFAYRQTGACPASAKRATEEASLQLVRSPLRENRWLRRPE